MRPRLRRQPSLGIVTIALLVAMLIGVGQAAAAAETPRRGGVLLAVIGADPPSLDPHQESTFANIELVAPLYSTLLQLDPTTTRRSSATSPPSGKSPPTVSPTRSS